MRCVALECTSGAPGFTSLRTSKELTCAAPPLFARSNACFLATLAAISSSDSDTNPSSAANAARGAPKMPARVAVAWRLRMVGEAGRCKPATDPKQATTMSTARASCMSWSRQAAFGGFTIPSTGLPTYYRSRDIITPPLLQRLPLRKLADAPHTSGWGRGVGAGSGGRAGRSASEQSQGIGRPGRERASSGSRGPR